MTNNVVMPWKPTNRIITIDPGLKTGFCTWTTKLEADLSGTMGWLDFEPWLWNQLEGCASRSETVHVQSEMFTISARTVRTAVQYESLYVNGATQFMCSHFGFTHAFSAPEHVMRIFDDNALKSLGLWTKSVHQRDAARHLGLVLLQRGIVNSGDMHKGDKRIKPRPVPNLLEMPD
jgi:hypothetical protein